MVAKIIKTLFLSAVFTVGIHANSQDFKSREFNGKSYTQNEVTEILNTILVDPIKEEVLSYIIPFFSADFPKPIHSEKAVFGYWNSLFTELDGLKNKENAAESQMNRIKSMLCCHFDPLEKHKPEVLKNAFDL